MSWICNYDVQLPDICHFQNIAYHGIDFPVNCFPSFSFKWADKSTTSYDMLNFISYTKSLTRKYLVIERHMFVELTDMSITNYLFNFKIYF